MDDQDLGLWFQSFDCESEPLAEGEPATPRPPHRPRDGSAPVTEFDGIFVSFDCESVPLAPGTPATPRPPGRPRPVEPVDPDTAFAGELAERVLEYVRGRPAGLSAEQLAALVQQLVARRRSA